MVWLSFLFQFQEKNKEDLFDFCAEGIPLADTTEGKIMISTKRDKSLSSSQLSRTHQLSPCTHEEAYTRGALHLKDMVYHNHTAISMRTVDTDWVVISLAHFHSLEPELQELYVEFGTGKNFR